LNTKRETDFGFGFSSVENAKFAFPAPDQFQKSYGFYNYTEVDEIYALIYEFT